MSAELPAKRHKAFWQRAGLVKCGAGDWGAFVQFEDRASARHGNGGPTAKGLPKLSKGVLQVGARPLALLFMATAALLLAFQAPATEGVYLQSHGPIQRSRAGAGVASPRDASWMLLNPAGLVDLDRRIDLGLDVILTDVALEPHGVFGNRFGGKMTDHQFLFVPSVGAVWPGEKSAYGLGLYVPSGIGVDFPQSRNLLSRMLQRNADRRLNCQHVRLVGAYAREFDNGWALGLSVNGSITRLRTDSLTLSLAPTQGGREWEDAFGAGFGLGIYRKWDKLAIGAAYQSRQWSQSYSNYRDLLGTCLDFPQTFQVGAAYRLNPALEIVADYKMIDWDSVALFGRDPLDGGFGWEDQHIVKIGFEWRINDRWNVRGGTSYGNSPIGRAHAFINGLTPVISEQHISAGVSYAISKKSEVHLTFLHAVDNTLTGSARGDLFSLLGAGTKINLGHDGVTFGYTRRF